MYETTNVLVILLVSLVIYMYVAYLVNLYGLPSHWFLYVGSTENKSENNPSRFSRTSFQAWVLVRVSDKTFKYSSTMTDY